MKKLITLLIAILSVAGIYADNYNEFLEASRKHLAEGNKEKAESCYRIYTKMTGKKDAELEKAFSSKAQSSNVEKAEDNNSKSISSQKDNHSIKSDTCYCFEDGSRYIGEIRDSMPNGRGIKTDIWMGRERTCKGTWSNGNMIYGTIIVNGKKYYEGETFESVPFGKGIIYFKGGRIEGNFKNDYNHGYCIIYNNDGSKESGIYNYGTLVVKEEEIQTIKYSNGNEYIGELRDGMPHGYGELCYKNGERFIGYFEKGKRINGLHIFKNRDFYEGEFKNDEINGYGRYFYALNYGEQYFGDFKNGKFHGDGMYYYANGDFYFGDFKNGRFHGDGMKYTYKNKSSEYGVWKNNVCKKTIICIAEEKISTNYKKRNQYIHKYIGQLKDGKYHGQGTFFWASGNRYEGEFKDGKRHGRGTFYWANGDRYEGEFKDGKYNGRGTYYFANGNRYEGEWKDDKCNGQGTDYFASGDRYEGEFKDGKRHGRGTYYYADGNCYEGEFNDGKCHGQGTMYYKDGTSKSGRWDMGKFVE